MKRGETRVAPGSGELSPEAEGIAKDAARRGRESAARIKANNQRRSDPLTPPVPDKEQVEVPEEAVELLAEHNAIGELYGWWKDARNREAKEARQRKSYAGLSEDIKDSWRDGAREQLALVAHLLRAQERERLKEALQNCPRLMRTSVGMCRTSGGAFIRRSDALATLDTEPTDV